MTDRERKKVIDEYNAFYRAKPNKWASNERNELTRTVIEGYLGKPPSSLMDGGCGIGHSIAYLSNFWPKTRFIGIDPSPVGIEHCKNRVPDAQWFAGFLGDAFPIKKVRIVSLLGVLEHIEDTYKALEDCKKYLQKNGLVHIEVPNCIAYPSSTGEEGFRRINVGNKQFEWHRTRESWENIFKDSGYDIVDSVVGPRQEYEFIWILEPLQ
jgi:trans-aconitate methyltransferase